MIFKFKMSVKPDPFKSHQLGHTDPAPTLRIHAHAIPQQAEDLSFADFDVPERPYAAPGNLAVGPQRRKSAKKVVTRARFERATPSFGDRNSALSRRPLTLSWRQGPA